MLRVGSRGDGVKAVQRLLGIAADGVFGPGTDTAVRAFQRSAGLKDDGVVGPTTMAALSRGSRTLTGGDLSLAAESLGVDVASVRAVTHVESRASGFLSDGRPVILFERHVMRRRLAELGRDVDLLQRYLPEIINGVPGGYKGGSAEHDRLYLAQQIDFDSAVESASWGLFQIMGFHWQVLGYESAKAFARAMSQSEGQQLDAFVRFIKADAGLHRALRSKNWADFAARYNGPAYSKNKYDVKLAEAYKEFA